MTSLGERIVQGFLQRADIGHVALFIWAMGASTFVAFTMREAAEAARRTETFMQDFLQELSRFNRNLEEDER
ncbi:MAG: hypothetical protein ACRCWF_08425 [Beijerinckiaceae bacterium]